MRSFFVSLLFMAPAWTGLLNLTSVALSITLCALAIGLGLFLRSRRKESRGINHALWRLQI